MKYAWIYTHTSVIINVYLLIYVKKTVQFIETLCKADILVRRDIKQQ